VKEEGVELAASDCCCRGDALRYCVKGMKKMKRCVRKMNEKKKRRDYRVWFCIFIKIIGTQSQPLDIFFTHGTHPCNQWSKWRYL
jgi:hypothetical protein